VIRANAGEVTLSGAVNNTGTVEVDYNGILKLLDGSSLSGGTVENSGMIDVSGASAILGTNLIGSGQVVVEGAANLTLSATTVTGNTIINFGTTTVANHSSVDLISGNDSDTFVFAQNFGRATIGNFTPGTDEIDLNPAIFSDFRALLAATQDVNGSAVITDAAHDTITIEHVTKAQLQASDFHFV
jgi:hypothetical protein